MLDSEYPVNASLITRARKADRKAEDSIPRRSSLRQRGVKAEGKHAQGIEDELRGGHVGYHSAEHVCLRSV
jgi:hypothetical protein